MPTKRSIARGMAATAKLRRQRSRVNVRFANALRRSGSAPKMGAGRAPKMRYGTPKTKAVSGARIGSRQGKRK